MDWTGQAADGGVTGARAVPPPATAERPGPEVRGQPHARGIYAALDLGTNNCRLLVALPLGDAFRVIDAFSRIVRLGEGIGASGVISAAAMERTVAALAVCAQKMRRRGVTHARCVATEACRRAGNGPEFLERVQAETGIELDVITTGEEARLAVAGCSPLIHDSARGAIVFDIGGGSTELTWVRRKGPDRHRPAAWTSLAMGVVTLAERYGGFDITRPLYETMVDDVLSQLAAFEEDAGIAEEVRRGGVQMLGTSGTVTTLAGVHLDLPRYDRRRVDGQWLSFDAVRQVSHRLRDMTYAERANHPCIGHDRADLVVAGCAILEAMCRLWPVGRLGDADRGAREGVLLSLMRQARLAERAAAGR